MASIEKRGNTFRITVSAGFDGNGKRLRFCETFIPESKTAKAQEREAKHYAEVLEEKVKNGKVGFDDGMTFSALIEKWKIQGIGKKGYKLETGVRESYLSNLDNHVVGILGNKKLSRIKKSDCQQVVDEMVKKGLSNATISRVIVAMSCIFIYAKQLSLISAVPYGSDNELVYEKTKKNNDDIHCFSAEEAGRFLQALKLKYPVKYGKRTRTDSSGESYEVGGYTSYREIGYQWQVYFHLAIKSGLRKEEMVALTWADINFANKSISVNKAVSHTKSEGQKIKGPKTASSKRIVPVPSDCIEMLEIWKDMQIEYSRLSYWEGQPSDNIDMNNVFIQDNGKRMDIFSPSQKFPKIIKMYNSYLEDQATHAKTEADKKRILADRLPEINLHALRHTYATLAITAGHDVVTVSKMLGHSSPSVTMDIYSHYLEKPARDVADTFEKLFNKNITYTEELRS